MTFLGRLIKSGIVLPRHLAKIVAVVAMFAFPACSKIEIPEDLNSLNFAGISAAMMNASDGAINLSWTPPTDSSNNAKSSGVGYTVYLMDMTGKVEEADVEGPSGKLMTLPEEKQPKFIGRSIAYVKDGTAYEVDPAEAGMKDGSIYGFQVVATASGQTVKEQGSVAVLKYSASLNSYGLSIVSGNFQRIETGATTPNDLVVKLSVEGKGAPGEEIHFSITSGGGLLSATKVKTDLNGRASVKYSGGPDSTTATIKASWRDDASMIEFTQFVASPDYQLSIFNGNFQRILTGAAASEFMTVKLQASGSPMVGETVNFSIVSGGGTLSAASATTDANGRAAVGYTAGNDSGTAIIKASWRSDTKTAEFSQFISSPDYQLTIINGNFQRIITGTAAADSLIVKLQAGSTPMVGEVIHFSILAGGGSITAADVTTDNNGRATIGYTAGPDAGTSIIKASWRNDTKSVEFSEFVFTQPDARTLTISDGNFQFGDTNTNFATLLKVQALDGSTPQNNQQITWTITKAPAGSTGESITPQSAATNPTGFATARFHAGNAAGSYEIEASGFNGARTVKFLMIAAVSATTQKVLKIVQAGTGGQPEINTESLDVAGGTLNLKAALYDITGTTWFSDVPADWTVVGGGFNVSDFATLTAGRVNVTFDPTRIGSTTIAATYAGTADPSIMGTMDQTGTITVTSSLVPALIGVASGNGQSGLVNSELGSQLRVTVTNQHGIPVPGAQVSFSVVQGGGVITSAAIVTTDNDGQASASARLGTVVGQNIFRATVVGFSSLTTDFNATGNVGPATKLAWGVVPSGAFELVPFNVQPTITIRDAFDNLVSNAQFDVTLEKASGNGGFMVGNILTRTSVNGVVTFTDLGWTEIGSVTLRARSAGDALTSVVSAAFTVEALPSRCSSNDANWSTQEGGCKDLRTGLVWSGVVATNQSYADAIWDASIAGASAPEAMHNYQTAEYNPAKGCSASYAIGTCDTTSRAICKDLSLGGYTDWYLPSESDFVSASGNGLKNKQSLPNPFVTAFGTILTTSIPAYHGLFNFVTGTTVNPNGPMVGDVICVRGNASARFSQPAKIVKAYQFPESVASGASLQFYFQVQDVNGNTVNYGGKTVTVTSVAGPIFSPTTRVGVISREYDPVFTSVQARVGPGVGGVSSASLVGSGTATMRLTAQDGFYSEFPVVVRGPEGCDIADTARWKSMEGGCKDTLSNLVWSRPGSATSSTIAWDSPQYRNSAGWTTDRLGWHADSNSVVGNTPGYCRTLTQGGYSDWYVPSVAQMTTAYSGTGNLPTAVTTVRTDASRYQVADYGNSGTYPLVGFSFQNGSTCINCGAYMPLCVREGTGITASRFPPATKISTTTVPATVVTNNSFTVAARVQTAASGNVFMQGGSFTISLASGSGTLSATSGGLTRTSFKDGTISFDNLRYTGTDNFTLRITGESLTEAVTTSIRAMPYAGACRVADDTSFVTSDGGCKDMQTNLVWSEPSTSSRTWGQAVWDGFFAGSTPPDQHDDGRTNELSVGTAGTCGSGGMTCDFDSGAYCHDLTEGGYYDWRLPSAVEFTTARANGIATRLNWGSNYYHAREATHYSGRTFRMSDGHDSNPGAPHYGHYTVCVRGVPRPAPTKVIGLPSFAHCKKDSSCSASITLQIADANNNPVNREGVTVGLVVQSGTGTLTGSYTAVTNKAGQATITGFTYDVEETATITTTNNAGFANPTTMALNVTPFDGGCLREGAGVFVSADGGCKNVGSGLVFSAISAATMTWGEAVWDSALAGSPQPDANDGTRTFDYDTATAYTGPDNSTSAYCHDLVQGGKNDWRLPTRSEALQISNNYVGLNGTPVTTMTLLWTGRSNGPSGNYFIKESFNLGNNQTYSDWAYTAGGTGSTLQGQNRVICVRGP